MASTFSLPAPGLSPADLLASAQANAHSPSPLKTKAMAAARDFEAIFLNSMFQSMETDVNGEGPFGGSGATGVWRSMLTDQYARNFAKAGGIGIADQVYKSLLAQQEVKA